MIIDGRVIASEIKSRLTQKVLELSKKGITPQLAVILIGDDPGSAAYVRAKKRTGVEIGIQVTIYPHQIKPHEKMINDSNHLSLDKKQLIVLVKRLNKDPSVHGIIVQRPLPIDIAKEKLDLLVTPEKDVDGFHPQTRFDPPIAMAVDKILQWVAHDVCNNPDSPLKQPFCEPYVQWLKKQKTLVIGRGETAGKPIAEYLVEKGAPIAVAHSKTDNLAELCRSSDVIISCVGKDSILRSTASSRNNGAWIVRRSMLTNKTILIGVGLHNEEGKLHTDYDLDEVNDLAAYYTPVPGGVGPVNVASLLENVVAAASASQGEALQNY